MNTSNDSLVNALVKATTTTNRLQQTAQSVKRNQTEALQPGTSQIVVTQMGVSSSRPNRPSYVSTWDPESYGTQSKIIFNMKVISSPQGYFSQLQR
ncbi:hypothetical protein Pyn_34244 [Prunus yedoensis var. nudiflora]|uniref:Uncharacterized protein n=1 Tax=Prunus yedoensis var. nudiflora TaxID=2094558 RepID=A0A314YXL6_PRUYE|nr:hypothetical protein Pyn_34244 [Prunus yedoensis var. nudiflora]